LGIMGESPADKLSEKLTWLLRCLGCPFTALFYSINIGSEEEYRCLYWLSSRKFFLVESEATNKGGERQENGKEAQDSEEKAVPQDIKEGVTDEKTEQVSGKEVEQPENKKEAEPQEQSTARISVLEKGSAWISGYFILVGVLASISKAVGSVNCLDWPYIPSLFSWTFLAVYRRISSKYMVVREPNEIFGDLSVEQYFILGLHYYWLTFRAQSDMVVVVNLSQYSAPYGHLTVF
ncbi:8085_t:CDS:2, partial [Acaulospora morrowiae]